jgi:hypothetical protein
MPEFALEGTASLTEERNGSKVPDLDDDDDVDDDDDDGGGVF